MNAIDKLTYRRYNVDDSKSKLSHHKIITKAVNKKQRNNKKDGAYYEKHNFKEC